MLTPHRLRAERSVGDYSRRQADQIISAVLGNNSGTVDVPNHNELVYIRAHGDPNQLTRAVLAVSIARDAGLSVAVRVVKRNAKPYYEVIGLARDFIYPDNVYAGAVGSHGWQHERRGRGVGGSDPADIYPRMIVPLRVRAQTTPGLTLVVEAGYSPFDGAYLETQTTDALVPPTSGGALTQRWDLVYLKSNNTIDILQGTAGVNPSKPLSPDNTAPLGYAILNIGQTAITEDHLDEPRMPYCIVKPTAQPHNVLSDSHGDADQTAPDDGDVFTWDAVAGKWKAAPVSGFDLAATIHAATEKAEPDDADEFGIWDSVAEALRKLTWANIVATLEAYFNTLYVAVANSGNIISKGHYGSEPASPNAGDLHLTDDAPVSRRSTGAAWENWGPLWGPLTPPVLGDFAWVNQGIATATQEYGGIWLDCSGDGTGTTSVHILKKTAPSTPYTITIAFIPAMIGNDWQDFSLVWRESSSGKLVNCRLSYNAGTLSVLVTKWDSPTSHNSDYFIIPGTLLLGAPIIFMRITDNGTNRICSVSTNLNHFLQVHSIGRTDFITPDEIGLAIVSRSSYAAGVNVLHWQES